MHSTSAPTHLHYLTPPSKDKRLLCRFALCSLFGAGLLATACQEPEQEASSSPATTAQQDKRCTGKTMPGQSGWKKYKSYGLYIDVDTSDCGFGQTPIYLSSLGGNGSHETVEGGTSIYFPTPTGFRIYLSTRASVELAESRKWHINWEALPHQSKLLDQCVGQTEPGNTKWLQRGSSGIFTHVDTKKCGLDQVPIYSTSLGGSGHWRALGETAVQSPTATGFWIFLYQPGLTVAFAKERKWHINWSAARRNLAAPTLCTGETKKEDWRRYGRRELVVNVDTTECGFDTTPTYMTSLYGDQHWRSQGSSAVHFATPTGFRVHVKNADPDRVHLAWKASLNPTFGNECTEGACCQNGFFRPADHACRGVDSSNVCDVPEYCTGQSAECPDDGFAPPTQQCRAQDPANACDKPEFCSGTSPVCPPDAYKASGTVCRRSLVGLGCDVEETCTGTSPSCPPDAFAAATTRCRAKNPNNACDAAEFCSGTSPQCPEDEPMAAGSGACREDEMDLGLHSIGVSSYQKSLFGADAAELTRATVPRHAGTAAARIVSGRNGLTQGWGMGARFAFPTAVNLHDYGRISYAIRSNNSSPNVKVALELLIDTGGSNQSVWRQSPSTQLSLNDITNVYKEVSLALSRDDFDRSEGAPDTTLDMTKVSGVQFLMLIEPGTGGAAKQAILYVDQIRFTDKWRLAGYETWRAPSIVAAEKIATPSDFDVGATSRLAVLITDPSDKWLGIVHGMKAVGTPIRVTDDIQEALKHKVVWVYPAIRNSSSDRALLREHVKNGGVLIAGEVGNTDMKDVFGFESARFVPGTDRIYNGKEISGLRFTDSYPTLTQNLKNSREKCLPIYRREIGENMPTVRYGGTKYPGIAVYDSDTDIGLSTTTDNVAVTYNTYGNGKAYAIGINVGLYALRSFNGFGGGMSRDYINGFDPAVDVMLRLVRDIYVDAESAAVTLAPLPNDQSLAVMLTHDIDTSESVVNAREYARMEQELGVPATYFIQTKYITDAQESAFRGVQAFGVMAELRDMDMEVASHSVAHALNFNNFELGDGAEHFPSYRPINFELNDSLEAIGGTVLGELRISRFILEDFVSDVTVKSFRPGHLKQPFSLSQAMVAVGYEQASIGAAADTMTHLPHKMTYGRGFRSETDIFDFPVTIEDERPDSPIVTNRVADALTTAEQISHNGGIFVMLVHPNFLGEKLSFMRAFIEQSKHKYMYTSVAEFGDWWARRDLVDVDSQLHGGILQVTLVAPRPLSGLTLELPKGMILSAKSQDVETSGVSDDSKLVVSGEFSGELKLYFKKK